MMFLKILVQGLVLTILLSTPIYSNDIPLKDVLIIYDSPNVLNSKETNQKTDFSFLLSQQLGHFNTKVIRMKEDEYKKGMIEQYDYIFYLSLREDKEANKNLLNDLLYTNKNIVWYGENADELIEARGNIPLEYHGSSYHYKQVKYKNKDMTISGFTGKNILIEPVNGSIKTYGSVSNGMDEYPLIINYNNYWFMTGLDTYNLKYLVFSDVLHEILVENHHCEKKVYLRIEDIHSRRSPGNIKKIANYLKSQDIPFMAVVIPVYIDPKGNQEYPLGSEKKIIDSLKYMVEKGGTIVQHGYTHQYYQSTTGEGFEFWDIKKDKPLNLDYQKYILDRVVKGLTIFLENDLYPLAFISPHYAMAQQGYQELKQYYSTIVGEIQTSDRRFNSSSFPYISKNTDFFNILIPESLGYVAINEEDSSITDILIKAEELSILRDVQTGVFFHPFIDINYLTKIIEGLRERGYTFGDLRDIENWVKVGDYEIKNYKGIIHSNMPPLNNNNEFNLNNYIEKSVNIFTLSLSITVFIVIILLVKKYYHLKIKYKRTLFEEEEDKC